MPVVELLGIGAGIVADPQRATETPVVVLTIRPDPETNWSPRSFALTTPQAKRLRDDLTRLLQQLQPSTQAS
jgi:hypothetical protein